MSRKVQSGFLYDQVKETIESEANHGWRLTQVIIPNKGKHSISGKKRLRLGAFFPWCYQLIFEKDEKENVLYEYKFYRVPLETKAQGSNVDCKDDFYMVKDFLLFMTDNDWKFKQIVIPFDEKKGIYCTLGYEVIFERKK